MKFVLVEKGKNQAGEIDYDFYMGKYQVTQKQWKKVIGSNPSYFKGKKLPVEQVSWYDAVEYCNKLSDKEGLNPYYIIENIKKEGNHIISANVSIAIRELGGKGYRLPTQKEWEYSARGGKKSKGYIYAGSNNIEEVAWYDENSEYKTHKVGTKKVNELGIYDMSGNVFEWCYDDTYDGFNRIISGGGWYEKSDSCDSSYCTYSFPYDRFSNIGFRVCRSL